MNEQKSKQLHSIKSTVEEAEARAKFLKEETVGKKKAPVYSVVEVKRSKRGYEIRVKFSEAFNVWLNKFASKASKLSSRRS